MQKEISEQQFWQAYDSVPVELQDAIFSEETAKTIFNACVENGVNDERISQVAKNVGDVLLGLLSPERLQPALELDLDLEPKAAENICQTIYNDIFEPVRQQLAELYLHNEGKEEKGTVKIKVSPETKKSLPKNAEDGNSRKEVKKSAPAKLKIEESSPISYREPIG